MVSTALRSKTRGKHCSCTSLLQHRGRRRSRPSLPGWKGAGTSAPRSRSEESRPCSPPVVPFRFNKSEVRRGVQGKRTSTERCCCGCQTPPESFRARCPGAGGSNLRFWGSWVKPGPNPSLSPPFFARALSLRQNLWGNVFLKTRINGIQGPVACLHTGTPPARDWAP